MLRFLLSGFLLFFVITQIQVQAQAQVLTPPQAAIATAHPLATQAGKQILQQGGNAFDAAVAITAALAVVEPYSSGLGGGGFWLIREQKHNQYTFIDGRETAPGKAHRDMYLDERGNYISKSSVNGPLSAGIPGTVAAMVHLSKYYGELPLKKVLQPAIKLADDGFPVTAHYQKMARFRLPVLNKYESSASILLENKKVPNLGHVIVQKDLANTLRRIAENGHAGFYQGQTAQQLVKAVQANGGIWELDDLKNYNVVEREPIKFQFNHSQIFSAPPPSSGGVALATMLQILQARHYQTLNEVSQNHLIIEAMRLAYRDRAEFLGDSDHFEVPVKRLIHPWYAQGLAVNISMKKAAKSANLPSVTVLKGPAKEAQEKSNKQGEGQDTTHFSVIDEQGNMVSSTMSINYPFGSGFIASGTGVLLNDEMDDFSSKPGTPNVYGLIGAEANAIAPGKRPLSSMSPTIVESDDGFALLGTPGGSRIITMVLLGLLEYDKGGEPQDWVERPRFHHQYLPDRVLVEPNTFSKSVKQALQKKGHQLKTMNDTYGNMQAIQWRFESGVKAAADPRVEGLAEVFKINP